MRLRPDENLQKIFRRHKTPYFFQLLKTTIAMLPFAAIVVLLYNYVSLVVTAVLGGIVGLLYLIVIIYISVVYWLDHFLVTNQRIVMVNWRNPFRREEYETELHDIQDIQTRENGFLARWNFFDYGLIKIEISSSQTIIQFNHAPDPEGIRDYLSEHLAKRHQARYSGEASSGPPPEQIL